MRIKQEKSTPKMAESSKALTEMKFGLLSDEFHKSYLAFPNTLITRPERNKEKKLRHLKLEKQVDWNL